MTTTALERVKSVFRREQPSDRVPIFELIIDPITINGIMPGATYEDLVEALDIDCVVSPTPSRMYGKEIIGYNGDFPIFKTEWGETRETTRECVAIPIDHPIKTHADWERYQIPDPEKPGRLDELKALVKRFKGKRAIGANIHDSLNYPEYLFGLESLMMNLILEPDWVKEVIEACNKHTTRLAELVVEAGADFVVLSDDFGGKSGPLMSVKHFVEFFLPGLEEVAHAAKQKGANVAKHSDGNITSLLPYFIEAGIEAFHPSDPSAGMDIVKIKQEFGDRLAVFGGIDTGDPLSNWPVDQLVAEVRKRIRELAPGGGWAISSSNTVHSSVKPENYHALVMATRTYGNYANLDNPINLDIEMSIGKIPIKNVDAVISPSPL
ncbi:MAG: hypothetical protein MUO42_04970 [Anaerolineaceae bacterium]|nr:hypothetical protein [Anaerolineaceae bacterium]